MQLADLIIAHELSLLWTELQ